MKVQAEGLRHSVAIGIGSASDAAVDIVLTADISADGRSQWLWIRFENGDLVLAVYPQGDTYFAAFEETGDDRKMT